MKNKIFYFILLLLMMTAYAPSALKAADISVGATTWYTKWETPDSWGFELNDPAFLYGPVMSVKFSDDWSFTLVFLYGQFKENVKFDIGGGTTLESKMEIDRYDSDAAINFRLNNYLKIFAGTKYMGYNYTIKFNDILGIPGEWVKADANQNSFGPGCGLSGVFPLSNDFYILANISAMYLLGSSDSKTESASQPTTSSSDDITQYGINTGASLAYYINAASTTISLGGRYQAYKTNYDSGDDTNKFWGATLTATYSFSI